MAARTLSGDRRPPARRRPSSEARHAHRSHTILYDPDGLIEAELPLDREPYESLVKAVLAWTGSHALTTRDYERIALQLTGHARRRANQLSKNSCPRALADVVLPEAAGRLSTKLEGTLRCARNRARLDRALYERLDRLEAAVRVQ